VKNSKKWFLTAVFVVTALMVVGQQLSADQSVPNLAGFNADTSGTAVFRTFNDLFSTSYTSNAQLSPYAHSGVFTGTTSIYYISGNPDGVSSTLTLFNSGSVVSSVSNFNFAGASYSSTVLGDYMQRQIYSGSGLLTLSMSVSSDWGFSGLYYSNNDLDNGGIANTVTDGYNHFIYFNVTSLLSGTLSPGQQAFLVGYEGLYDSWMGMDYADGLFLVVNNAGGDEPTPTGVPEPATMLLWSLGGLGLAGTSWYRKRTKKNLHIA